MNTRRKGRETENRAKKVLEAQGYRVEQVIHTRYHRNDFFNRFDLIAKKKTFPTRWVQVKTNRYDKGVFLDIKDFKDNYGNDLDSFELWVWIEKKQEWKTFLI